MDTNNWLISAILQTFLPLHNSYATGFYLPSKCHNESLNFDKIDIINRGLFIFKNC